MQGPIAARIRSGCAPSSVIARTVASITPASAPRQPAWAAPITPAARVGEQHRRAVGAEHAKRHARAVADQRIGRRGSGGRVAGARATTTSAPWTWRTVQRLAARDPEPGQRERAVPLDQRGLVAAGIAAVERGELVPADPARAGEEAVADRCRVGGGSAAWSMRFA